MRNRNPSEEKKKKKLKYNCFPEKMTINDAPGRKYRDRKWISNLTQKESTYTKRETVQVVEDQMKGKPKMLA